MKIICSHLEESVEDEDGRIYWRITQNDGAPKWLRMNRLSREPLDPEESTRAEHLYQKHNQTRTS